MGRFELNAEDKAAIVDLCVEYNWKTDTGDARGVAELHTVDAVWDGPPGRFEGRAAIEQFNVDVYRRIRGSMHFNDNHQFEVRGDVVVHRCYGAVHMPRDQGYEVVLVTYEDVVVKDGDHWRFRERVARQFAPPSRLP